jgi:hypothetical protein
MRPVLTGHCRVDSKGSMWAAYSNPAIRHRYLPFRIFRLAFAIWLLLVMASLISMAVSDFLKHS